MNLCTSLDIMNSQNVENYTTDSSVSSHVSEESYGKNLHAVEDGNKIQRRSHYTCMLCPYKSNRKNNMKRHFASMHVTSTKLLECCGSHFSNKADFRSHTKSAHGGGYRCDFCSRYFSRKALLRRHLSVHNGHKDFFCAYCNYSSSHKSNLERHNLKLHGIQNKEIKTKKKKAGTSSTSTQLQSPKDEQCPKDDRNSQITVPANSSRTSPSKTNGSAQIQNWNLHSQRRNYSMNPLCLSKANEFQQESFSTKIQTIFYQPPGVPNKTNELLNGCFTEQYPQVKWTKAVNSKTEIISSEVSQSKNYYFNNKYNTFQIASPTRKNNTLTETTERQSVSLLSEVLTDDPQSSDILVSHSKHHTVPLLPGHQSNKYQHFTVSAQDRNDITSTVSPGVVRLAVCDEDTDQNHLAAGYEHVSLNISNDSFKLETSKSDSIANEFQSTPICPSNNKTSVKNHLWSSLSPSTPFLESSITPVHQEESLVNIVSPCVITSSKTPRNLPSPIDLGIPKFAAVSVTTKSFSENTRNTETHLPLKMRKRMKEIEEASCSHLDRVDNTNSHFLSILAQKDNKPIFNTRSRKIRLCPHPYKCPECHLVFRQQQDFTNHTEKAHSLLDDSVMEAALALTDLSRQHSHILSSKTVKYATMFSSPV